MNQIGFVKLVGLSALLGLISIESVAVEPQKKTSETVQVYRQRQEAATPQSVLAWLKEGNIRFAGGRSRHGGYPLDARNRMRISAQGQRPLAAILSCIDSRTAPELVFDMSAGDLFTARVGANVTNDDILGSLEIAAESGAKVVLVLGHTDCGGIKGACSGLELGHMTQLLERVKPAIEKTHSRLDADPMLSKEVGERNINNRRYIAEVSHDNAIMSATQLRQRSSILREKIEFGEILLLSAVYDVDSGLVRFDTTN